MQTFTPDNVSASQICLGKPPDKAKHKCRGLESATEAVYLVETAGVWESVNASSVAGVRRQTQSTSASSVVSDDEDDIPNPVALTSAVRQRASKPKGSHVPSKFANRHHAHTLIHDTDPWEAWTLSSTGEYSSRSLLPDDHDDAEDDTEEDLLVVTPGPIAKLGKRSVAVGFGTTVKIITLGKELLDGMAVLNGGSGLDMGLGSYRARTKRGTDRKAL